jgi:CubicO group peptidase (beta-lactamase class C family)
MSGVEQRLAAAAARHGVIGATAGVWDRGETEGAAVGLADAGSGRLLGPPTVMHVASVTKPVVAAAFLRTAASYVDTAVIELVPELRSQWRASSRLTARHLLSHTSGLHRDLPTFPDAADPLLEAVRRIVAHKQELRPGRAWRYCNGGFWLAGLTLARVSGTTFEDAVATAVLSPAAMAHSGFERPGEAALGHASGQPVQDSYSPARRPGGGLCSNVGDLLRFAQFLIERPEVLERMATPITETTSGSRYGLGLELKDGLAWHGGSWGGYHSCLLLAPAERFAAVALVNDVAGEKCVREIVAGELLAARGLRSPWRGLGRVGTAGRAMGRVAAARATRFLR